MGQQWAGADTGLHVVRLEKKTEQHVVLPAKYLKCTNIIIFSSLNLFSAFGQHDVRLPIV